MTPTFDTTPSANPTVRVGHGYDLHRLEPIAPAGEGKPLVLAGVPLPHDRGPVGHSDADVLLHAVTDAILGALGLPDIGQLFPDEDPANASRASADFLSRAVGAAGEAGWSVSNVDCTVVLERPKLAPVKGRLRAALAGLLGVPQERVNVKGKTHEGVDAVGEGRAIEAHAVVLLTRSVA